jgi:hypothetical protein
MARRLGTGGGHPAGPLLAALQRAGSLAGLHGPLHPTPPPSPGPRPRTRSYPNSSPPLAAMTHTMTTYTVRLARYTWSWEPGRQGRGWGEGWGVRLSCAGSRGGGARALGQHALVGARRAPGRATAGCAPRAGRRRLPPHRDGLGRAWGGGAARARGQQAAAAGRAAQRAARTWRRGDGDAQAHPARYLKIKGPSSRAAARRDMPCPR